METTKRPPPVAGQCQMWINTQKRYCKRKRSSNAPDALYCTQHTNSQQSLATMPTVTTTPTAQNASVKRTSAQTVTIGSIPAAVNATTIVAIGTILFPKHPPKLPPHVSLLDSLVAHIAALKHKVCRNLIKSLVAGPAINDKPGSIYIFNKAGKTSQTHANRPLQKIGLTKRTVVERVQEWQRQSKSKLMIKFQILTTKVHHAEPLIHKVLDYVRLKLKNEIKVHQMETEWFDIDQTTAENVITTVVRYVNTMYPAQPVVDTTTTTTTSTATTIDATTTSTTNGTIVNDGKHEVEQHAGTKRNMTE
jgi:hypothetical protein